MIGRYPDVFTDMPRETNEIQHRVKLTDDTLIRCKPYPLPYAIREELRYEVDSMLEMGVVKPSMSPYVSPIIMVKKKDGSNRVCVDFRMLNKITEVDPEPMITAEYISVDSVAGNTCPRSIFNNKIITNIFIQGIIYTFRYTYKQ